MSTRRAKKTAVTVCEKAIAIAKNYIGHTSLSDMLVRAMDFNTYQNLLYYAVTFNRENGCLVGYDDDEETYHKFNNYLTDVFNRHSDDLKKELSFSTMDDILKKDLADAVEILNEVKTTYAKDEKTLIATSMSVASVCEDMQKDVYKYLWGILFNKFVDGKIGKDTALYAFINDVVHTLNKEICRHNSSEYRKCYNYFCKTEENV